MSIFNREADFETALIEILTKKGWESKVIKYPTEEDLIKNWAHILFQNNRSRDCLNDQPLTSNEMGQIMAQIADLKTPLKLNNFINGKSVIIRRDNPDDTLNNGKEVSLKIYDRMEIAAGQSRYQIVQQPKFKNKSSILNDRRGDLMLLINGMPVIHIELKRSGISVSQACNQIEKYSREDIFSGIFSLIQVFVAMEPEETVYFANPGADGRFNKDFYFHWADFNNEPINNWKSIASFLLSIPMAHQLIGFYTVADNSDGILKVMRSYQYYAASAISDRVSKINWNHSDNLGGYVWHTTGSGKTMTSFKSAQLIANSKDADKVIFLMDRIELGTQAFNEYQGFADQNDNIQDTENTYTLISKLKSNDANNTLIVTSIQKMSRIKSEEGVNEEDIKEISSKRIVIIIDEAHRSTFGDMLRCIKNTFLSAVFFGFTGTPIHIENQKKMNTTDTIFGNELHRYSIADGIRDKNVLGFDTYKILTFKDRDVREVVALYKAKATSKEEAMANPRKKEIFYKHMDSSLVKMAGYKDFSGKYIKGIEDELPNSQYRTDEHTKMVVKDICDNWLILSHNSKFHAIFATSSIPEAINYYRLLKNNMPTLKVTCLFDPNIDNVKGITFKEDGLIEIIQDYNNRYDQNFSMKNHLKFKKDVSSRLAHRQPYLFIEKTPEKQIDILIVVNQMLTGFDSKWINTLYLDKILEYENIIQAFSRTNRLFGPEKPFGTIRYYRYPHTMEKNIELAVKTYSGDKPIGVFVERLEQNINELNIIFDRISMLFLNAGIDNFEKLPDNLAEREKFASFFKLFNNHLEAAIIQGFQWSKKIYQFGELEELHSVNVTFDENTYLVLALRYKELFSSHGGSGVGGDVPFEIIGHLTEIDTGRIDSNYMNSRFEKYLKVLKQTDPIDVELKKILEELHSSFSILPQEQQKYANIFLRDIERGNIEIERGKTFRDYVTEYQTMAKNKEIQKIVEVLGLNEKKLRELIIAHISPATINEFGRFDELKNSIDINRVKKYFEKFDNNTISTLQVRIKLDRLLENFIIQGGFDIDEYMSNI